MMMKKEERNRWIGKVGTVVFIAVLAAACDDDPVGPDPVVYEGEVAGVGEFADLGGDVSFEAAAATIEVTVTLADYPDQGDGFPWILREGTCANPGDALGELDDYPLIELDQDDTWSDEAEVSINNDEDAYIFELRRAVDDEETVIACGDLARL